MSLGSRIASRGKAAVVASLTSTPREPRLFLYPLHARNISTITPKPTCVRNNIASLSRAYTAPATKLSNPDADARGDSLQGSHYVENERELLPTGHAADDEEHGEGSTEKERAMTEPYLSKQEELRRKVTEAAKTRKANREALEKRLNKTLQIRERAQRSALLKRKVRKVYQEVRRQERGSWTPDWRIILGELRRKTPWHPKWVDKAVSISVPATAETKLLRGVDDNIWEIAGKYDCSVTLGKPDEQTGQFKEFILSGSGVAISKTAAEAIRIAPGSRIMNMPRTKIPVDNGTSTAEPTFDSDEEPGLSLRYVKSENLDKMRALRPDEIPRPEKWTTDSFADYVDRLTSMEMTNHMHHLRYKKGEDHVRTIIKTLREVFTDPDCKSSLSRTSFKKALDYFVKVSNIAEARAAFVLMDISGLQMDPDTFNILLQGAAKSEDLHNFQFILHLMLRRGILPNGNTWVAFLMANNDSRIKSYIVAMMKTKGLLAHPRILRKVCQELVIREANTSLDLGQTQNEFLEHMDSRYGKDWLTVDTGNRILHALGARGIISRCWDFLRVMAARFIKIDHVSINTILNHCKQQTNVVGAIEIMRLLPSLIPYEPDSHACHILFEIAWRKRSFNLARVVWKYACLNAATTARMRMLMVQSLINIVQTPDPELSQLKRWRQQAGFVISNDVFEHPLSWRATHDSSDETRHENIDEHVSEPGIQQAVARKEVLQAVTRHLERDYQIFEDWKSARPFADELAKAWELDREWRKERMRSEGGEQLDWKIQEAIPVPVLSRHRSGDQDIVRYWR